jgi:hypothetical protein
MRILLIALFSGGILACTDTDRASIVAFGSPGHIQCYSGGALIYEGDSTGRIQTVTNSDGWEFQEAKTGKFVRVSGACVIKN